MPEHPYVEFESTPAWMVLYKVILELEENQDLDLMTPKEYVVGYICKQLAEKGMLATTAWQDI